ncbi:hypothetical protein B0J11DRAFT_579091 [Dendryphion nanum]|uniref:Amidohydrolase-related domain-containing protein n=1 Tax=Dendryphion nanum TaxID=256645 RepID=A0A9P9DWP6_9PLEO|nr:hypothetical protein B0J11DRAFT_579091 [Dendryphion nanum]
MSSVSSLSAGVTDLAQIRENALRDSIDLNVLPFLDIALTSVADISKSSNRVPILSSAFQNGTRIDTHTHPVPDWFRELQPLAAGRETPNWTVAAHLDFMAAHQITHSILSVSTPQANAFPGDKPKTIALARLLNEFVAAVVRTYPEQFSWLAVTALPYVNETLREVKYAIEELGAVGVVVLTNHEGLYPGDVAFDPLWQYLQERGTEKEVVFIHPTDPVIRLEDGRLVNSNPSPLRSGLGEFYFETARAISSITANRTIMKFPGLHWRISHGAGAFPDIQDRFLLGFPNDAADAEEAYRTRFWYDSAGPVYPRQIKGLLSHNVPVSQLVFGTDYPYGIGFWDVNTNIAGLANDTSLTPQEKEAVFSENALGLWSTKIERLAK